MGAYLYMYGNGCAERESDPASVEVRSYVRAEGRRVGCAGERKEGRKASDRIRGIEPSNEAQRIRQVNKRCETRFVSFHSGSPFR